jgi:mono/diheme cytochrome c family protein
MKLEPGEMQDLLAYLWARQFFEDAGNPAAGRIVFGSKHCANCHENSLGGAPKLTGSQRPFTSATMISALWHHGPRMLEQMKAQNLPWPRFAGRQMADLIAYLNSK